MCAALTDTKSDGLSAPENESGKRRDSRIRKKALCTSIQTAEARDYASTQYLLTCLIQTQRKTRTTDCPRSFLAMEETCRTAFELYTRMVKTRLGADDIRENLENLACLCDQLMKVSTKAASASDSLEAKFSRLNGEFIEIIFQKMADLLRNLIRSLEVIAARFERAFNVRETNWIDVRKHFETVADALEKIENVQRIPEIGMIQAERILGAGGFGVCYKGVFAGVLICTLKIIKDEMFDQIRFACVDKVVASVVNHPLIVKYYACFACEKHYITLMEYIQGVDLERIIKASKERGLPMNVLRPVLAQLGIAIQYIHRKGFIHRDIKPSNVLLTPGCRLKLIDFDTVKICIGMFSERKLKTFFKRTFLEFNDRESAGTLNYFPPEFFKTVPYGRACDWWATGVTAYQMAFSRMPFRGADDKKLEAKIRLVEYKFPKRKCRTEYVIEIKDLITRLLRKKSNERLCSRRYTDYLNHKLFEGLDFDQLEKAEHFIEFDEICKLMRKSGDHYSPKAAESIEKDQKTYVRPEGLKDIEDHCQLLTYVAQPLQDAVKSLKSNQPVSLNQLVEPPELIIAADTKTDKVAEDLYRFKSFEKSCGSSER